MFPSRPCLPKSPRPKKHHSATLFCVLRSRLQPIAIIQSKSASADPPHHQPSFRSINAADIEIEMTQGHKILALSTALAQRLNLSATSCPLSSDTSTSLTGASGEYPKSLWTAELISTLKPSSSSTLHAALRLRPAGVRAALRTPTRHASV